MRGLCGLPPVTGNRTREWLASTTLLADVCAALGDRERAQVLYRQLLPFARLNAHAFPEMILGSFERPLGVLAALRCDWDVAEDHFVRAIANDGRMGSRPWVAHARHDFARALIAKAASGDRGRASELLADALGTYRELAMKPWEQRAEADRQGSRKSRRSAGNRDHRGRTRLRCGRWRPPEPQRSPPQPTSSSPAPPTGC